MYLGVKDIGFQVDVLNNYGANITTLNLVLILEIFLKNIHGIIL
jgi:hypothetical protein